MADAQAAVLDAIQRAQDPLSGPAPEWPDEAVYEPEAVQSALHEGFPDIDIRLECSEFPCIGVIETGPDVPADLAADLEANWFPKEAYGRINAHLKSAGLEDFRLSVTQRQPDGGGHRFLVTWLTEEHHAEIEPRLTARFDWLAEHGLAEDRLAE